MIDSLESDSSERNTVFSRAEQAPGVSHVTKRPAVCVRQLAFTNTRRSVWGSLFLAAAAVVKSEYERLHVSKIRTRKIHRKTEYRNGSHSISNLQ